MTDLEEMKNLFDKLCLDYLLFEEEEFDSIEIENTFAYIFDKDGKFHGTEY